ncbi:ABC transporter ATP-binding protein [Streptomyces clavuligerus]|nr:ABC transporter ATP-binding protein [Streptomyces clavuligerus]MBY6307671.1 ABC transporter ATP-binding protein [Streptomyces clavuligerus]WDN56487.1 ABC transporter ATP-binding protein/permease [Streptomyces clavuligerus]
MKDESPLTGGRLLLQQLRPVRAASVVALLAALAGVAATLAGPLLIQRFVDRAGAGADESALMAVALIYLAVAAAGTTVRVISGYLAARAGWSIADGLRRRLLRNAAVERPVLETEGRQTGAVLEEIDGNSDIVGTAFAEAGFRMVANVVTAVGILAVMVVVVPAAGTGITLLTAVMFFAFARLTRRATRRFGAARQEQAEFFGFVGDGLAARDDLLPLDRAEWATDATRLRLDSLFRVEGRAYMAGRSLWPLAQLFFALSLGLALGFGLRALGHGDVTVGTLTMLYLYVNLLQEPLEKISSQAEQLQRMMAVLTLSARTLDREGTVPAHAGAPAGEPPTGPQTVSFEKVTFGYGDEPVLRDVTFSVPAGGSLGIVGPTGAGKSTVVNLLCGIAAPDEGRVTIGGVDAAAIPPEQLAHQLTVLSQQAHLFADSLRDNITLHKEGIPTERIWEVLERLGAADWVRALPEGLDTRVGTGGRQLSEGEAQLVTGARALVHPGGVLVIDEGTSRLDPEAERSWAAVVGTLMRDRTVIMVAHRTETLRDVDGVLVLRDGRVAEPVSGLLKGDLDGAGAAS